MNSIRRHPLDPDDLTSLKIPEYVIRSENSRSQSSSYEELRKRKMHDMRLILSQLSSDAIQQNDHITENLKSWNQEQHDLLERCLNKLKPENGKEEMMKNMNEVLIQTMRLCKAMEQQPTINVGETYNVARFLSSSSRDYLINSYNEQVKIDQLSGKYIILYLWGLSDRSLPYRYDPAFNGDLEEMYSVYSPLGMLEVVFVAFGNDKDNFDESFSPMPWLAIPHEDQQARYSLQEKFAVSSKASFPRVYVFDPQGMVLETNAHPRTRAYGAEGFPFSKQRIDQINSESDAIWDAVVSEKQRPSLTSLLGHFLINGEGNKVPTSELEGKTVGLYFFETGREGIERTSLLLELWKLLKEDEQCKNFEIVFINADRSASQFFCTDAFKNMFTIPWFIFPFDGRPLRRVFRVGCDSGYFIMLEPDKYEPLSYFALEIYNEFGIDAYPFTIEGAVTVAKRKQQENLVLNSLLDPSMLVFREEESSTAFWPRLSVKRVLLVFANVLCVQSGEFLRTLERMRSKRLGADCNFEIIYVSLDNQPLYVAMPWFVTPHVLDSSAALFLLGQLFGLLDLSNLPAIAAFGLDGHLETKESNLAYKRNWNLNYPFIQEDMANEVRRELVCRHEWDIGSL